MPNQQDNTALDPAKTVCVIRHNGKQVGRIAATGPNASEYIAGLVQHYREGVTVDYEQIETEAMVSRLFAGKPR